MTPVQCTSNKITAKSERGHLAYHLVSFHQGHSTATYTASRCAADKTEESARMAWHLQKTEQHPEGSVQAAGVLVANSTKPRLLKATLPLCLALFPILHSQSKLTHIVHYDFTSAQAC